MTKLKCNPGNYQCGRVCIPDSKNCVLKASDIQNQTVESLTYMVEAYLKAKTGVFPDTAKKGKLGTRAIKNRLEKTKTPEGFIKDIEQHLRWTKRQLAKQGITGDTTPSTSATSATPSQTPVDPKRQALIAELESSPLKIKPKLDKFSNDQLEMLVDKYKVVSDYEAKLAGGGMPSGGFKPPQEYRDTLKAFVEAYGPDSFETFGKTLVAAHWYSALIQEQNTLGLKFPKLATEVGTVNLGNNPTEARTAVLKRSEVLYKNFNSLMTNSSLISPSDKESIKKLQDSLEIIADGEIIDFGKKVKDIIFPPVDDQKIKSIAPKLEAELSLFSPDAKEIAEIFTMSEAKLKADVKHDPGVIMSNYPASHPQPDLAQYLRSFTGGGYTWAKPLYLNTGLPPMVKQNLKRIILADRYIRQLPPMTPDSVKKQAKDQWGPEEKRIFQDRLCTFNPDRALVRLVNLDKATFNRLFGSGTYLSTQVMSTSLIPPGLDGFSSNNVQMRLTPKPGGEGKFIEHMKGNYLEGEVVYPIGTEWKVEKIETRQQLRRGDLFKAYLKGLKTGEEAQKAYYEAELYFNGEGPKPAWLTPAIEKEIKGTLVPVRVVHLKEK